MEKVLHVLPMNKMSGAERMALLLCKNLKSYKPIVVCGGEELSNIFRENGIYSYSIKFSNKNLLGNAYELSKIIKNENIKVVHAHDNNASLNAYLAKKLYRLDVKIISHIHSCYPFLKEESLNKKVDSFLRTRYDHNIVCGKLVYDFYKDNTNYLLDSKTTIISNAIDINEITNISSDKGEEIRSEFNIPKDKIILGFVGRICEIKGIIPFIKEFAKYKEEFTDCRVLLVGGGEQEYEIKEILKELELEGVFILTGFQNDVYKFYHIIDVFFLPSLYEGLPMVLLEAMAFKKPIVSMNVGSISEIINKDTGILVDEKNYNKFINELIKIKSNEKLALLLGNNAFDYIENNFNIDLYIEKIVSIYNSILSTII